MTLKFVIAECQYLHFKTVKIWTSDKFYMHVYRDSVI